MLTSCPASCAQKSPFPFPTCHSFPNARTRKVAYTQIVRKCYAKQARPGDIIFMSSRGKRTAACRCVREPSITSHKRVHDIGSAIKKKKKRSFRQDGGEEKGRDGVYDPLFSFQAASQSDSRLTMIMFSFFFFFFFYLLVSGL